MKTANCKPFFKKRYLVFKLVKHNFFLTNVHPFWINLMWGLQKFWNISLIELLVFFFWNGNLFSALKDFYKGPWVTMQDHMGPYVTICDHTGPLRTNQDYMWLFMWQCCYLSNQTLLRDCFEFKIYGRISSIPLYKDYYCCSFFTKLYFDNIEKTPNFWCAVHTLDGNNLKKKPHSINAIVLQEFLDM